MLTAKLLFLYFSEKNKIFKARDREGDGVLLGFKRLRESQSLERSHRNKRVMNKLDLLDSKLIEDKKI